jgi:hypothetical protein
VWLKDPSSLTSTLYTPSGCPWGIFPLLMVTALIARRRTDLSCIVDKLRVGRQEHLTMNAVMNGIILGIRRKSRGEEALISCTKINVVFISQLYARLIPDLVPRPASANKRAIVSVPLLWGRGSAKLLLLRFALIQGAPSQCDG